MAGLLRRICLTVMLSAWPLVSIAQSEATLDRLMEVLRISDTIEIMREEGRGYGEDVAAEMLPGADAESWEKTVMRIHDPDAWSV